jgi:hypothetical protein
MVNGKRIRIKRYKVILHIPMVRSGKVNFLFYEHFFKINDIDHG